MALNNHSTTDVYSICYKGISCRKRDHHTTIYGLYLYVHLCNKFRRNKRVSGTRIYQDISITIKNLDSTCHDLWCYICLLLSDCKHPSLCLRSSHLSSGWLTSTCWSSRSSKCSGASTWSPSLTLTLTSTSTELPLSCLSHS